MQLVTNQAIVKQNEFKKKSSRQARKGLFRSPVFYKIISWRPWRSLREIQSFPIFSSSEKFKYV
jgi:hypothetical protein